MTDGVDAVHALLACEAKQPLVPSVLWEVPILECSAPASMLPRGAPQAGRVTIGIVSDVKLALAAALGTACRALGLRVSCDEDFLPALQEALQANRPALIEVMTELEFISPTATLSQVSASQPGR